jgi:hypothetical protein
MYRLKIEKVGDIFEVSFNVDLKEYDDVTYMNEDENTVSKNIFLNGKRALFTDLKFNEIEMSETTIKEMLFETESVSPHLNPVESYLIFKEDRLFIEKIYNKKGEVFIIDKRNLKIMVSIREDLKLYSSKVIMKNKITKF